MDHNDIGESRMKIGMAWMLAACMALPASAQELTPAAHLQFDFGKGHQPPAERLRLQLLAEARNWPLRTDEQALPMAVASVELGLGQSPYSTLLGVPLRASADRSAAAEGDSGGNTWLWIGAGLVGAVAVAALAAGGGDKEENNSTASNNSTTCGVGGTVVGPGGPDVGVGSCSP